MSVTTSVTVPRGEVAFGRALCDRPDVRIELERMVPLRQQAAPSVWIASRDTEWVEAAVTDDSAVAGVDVLGVVDEGLLLRVEWTGTPAPLIEILADTGATCLEGVGTADGWHLTLRYPTQEAFTRSYHRCLDAGIDLSVQRVHSPGRTADYGVESLLTEPQREALTEALACGYFDVPREVTLQALADRLGVSDTAASQRLRRGLQNVLAETLR
ncbi:hypothetical protein DVK02_11385 [Halobellus sp. Atlit-31R]|nr:hypothetical protein DVK02_11385 [Halobellus sp. Atlit-31R]